MKMKNKSGSTLIEMMVALMMFTVIASAGSILFLSGQSAWSVTNTEIELQDSLRQILMRGSAELQESGTDKDGNLQVSFLNNTGVNSSDILRFSVPICVCGTSIIDENGDVKAWGAPLTWGDAGCSEDYTVGNNGKVDICHLPPGNPTNELDLSVSVNAIKAHLAHGDRIGDCADCDTSTYTNRQIEYRMDSDGNMVRNVLNSAATVIASDVFAKDVSDFQVSLNASNTIVTLTITLSKETLQNRSITKSANIDVLLRN